MKPGAAKHVRCAIYTRVSTDQGLEQDFNSLAPNLSPYSRSSAAKRLRFRLSQQRTFAAADHQR
jgi:hypothetical protein